jgi:hypothetical protein
MLIDGIMKKVNFQSKVISYPSKLYLTGFFLYVHELNKHSIVFSFRLLPNLKAVRAYTSEILNNQNSSECKYLDTVLVVDLILQNNFPLKKEMWEQDPPTVESHIKILNLIDVVGKKEFYNLIVTPVISNNAKIDTDFYLAFPALKTASDDEMVTLMKGSDMYVSPEAKNAALYSIKKMYGYNPFTRVRTNNEKLVN